MKKTKRRFVLCFISAAFLSACSGLKEAFPDKEQDYKQSKELPPLEVPPDLTASTIEDPSIQTPDASGSASYTELLKDKKGEQNVESTKAEPSKLVASEIDGAYVEVKRAFPRAWRLVGKALSNLEIEVADRNRSIGMYYILYEDPQSNAQAIESFWSRLAFWEDIEVKEKEKQYRVKLEEWGETTKVFVLNTAGKKQSTGVGLHLLKKIEENLTAK